MPGTLIISLDYELFWGVYDSKQISSYQEEILGVHSVFPQILALFEQYDVKATIAVVGCLLIDKKTDLLESIPPSIIETNGAGFADYVQTLADTFDGVHADQGLFKDIQDAKRHELASHTHTHYYCDEAHSSLEDFKEDIAAFKKVSEQRGLYAKSFVFPRNQVSAAYVEELRRAGYTTYRGNPAAVLHQKGVSTKMSFVDRGLRALDSYINITGPLTCKPRRAENGLVDIPASFFLRPVSHAGSIPAKLQLRRIKKAMTHAAKEDECIHLWWHPHNFGRNQKANLLVLKEILVHFNALRTEGKFENLTMAELGARVNENA